MTFTATSELFCSKQLASLICSSIVQTCAPQFGSRDVAANDTMSNPCGRLSSKIVDRWNSRGHFTLFLRMTSRRDPQLSVKDSTGTSRYEKDETRRSHNNVEDNLDGQY